MAEVVDTAGFDGLSWHDDTLYGLRLDVGDPERGDWHADLVLDIDHIVAWEPSQGGQMRFRVAPATLAFHHATDLAITLVSGDSGCSVALHGLAIDRIERTRLSPSEQRICLDRPYWRWRIAFNWPAGGVITFGASGFTLTHRAEPVLLDQQSLPPGKRA